MDALEEPQVVVECILSDESVQTLYLTYTQGASRESAPELSEAEAKLTDLTESKEAGHFSRSADGSWKLDYAAIPSHRYRLDVSVPGHEPVWAEQEMPEVPSVDVQWDWWRENLPEDAKYRMVHGYIFSVDTLHSPVWFYGINYPDMDSEGEITDNLATDYPEVDRFNEQSSKYAGTSAYGSSYFKPSVYPDLEGAVNHRHYLRFPAREAERTEFLVSGDFRGCLEDKTDFVHSRKRFPELHYFAASEDYDRFLTDAYQLEEVSASSDLSSIFLRDNVYSNIQGATGIFGAKIERTLLWDDDRYWGEGPFIFAGLEEKVDHGGSPSPRNSHFPHPASYVSVSQAPWLSHRPFRLLHYKIQVGEPEEWKYGIVYPDYMWLEKYYEKVVCRIDNEEQLHEHGLEEYGHVDFSKYTVLVVYVVEDWPFIPFIIDYWIQEDPLEGNDTMAVYFSRLIRSHFAYTPRMDPFVMSSFSLIVDKIAESANIRLCYYDFLMGYLNDYFIQDYVFPEMGIDNYGRLGVPMW